LNVQHNYDVGGKILYAGNGDTRRASTIGQTVLQGRNGLPLPPGTRTFSAPSWRPDGGYYIADATHEVVLDQNGKVVAGIFAAQPAPCSSSGDGGPATQARICNPTNVAAAPDGSFYVVDAKANNSRIRRVGVDGIIRTIAGGSRD